MVTVSAPAKINLTLEVLGERGDGFHEIRSLIQTIDLCDTLRFRTGSRIEIKADLPEWVAGRSLVTEAVAVLKEATGFSGGAGIDIEKRVPLLSGLGGDSSDAAAVLKGLNLLWELDLPGETLLQLAGRLGSDVPFFLSGGTALLQGRGEIVTPQPSLPPLWVVVAVPPVPRQTGKTKRLYQSLGAGHFTDGQITRELADRLEKGGEFDPSLLFNTFENVAFDIFPGLEAARGHFIKLGAADVHLAGSGPALFTLMEDKAAAEEMCSLLGRQRMEPHLAGTLASIEKPL
ncbi:MAG: 4-(cytidine 5'-diphospho)-2-C-methyl-D-erythritol kinase [Dehalococcoidales bacterium]